MAGQGGERPLLLALSLLASLPLWMRRTFRIRVAADAAFGTAWFLFGVRRLGLETVVGMRRDRRLRGGGRLLDLRRQGSRVYLWRELAGGQGGQPGFSCPSWWCRSSCGSSTPWVWGRPGEGVKVYAGYAGGASFEAAKACRR